MPQNGGVISWLQRSYAADYVGFAMLLAAYLLIQFFMVPFHRLFSLDDLHIQYPHAEVERVPVAMMFVYAGAVPILVVAVWCVVARTGWHKAHVTILGLLISLVLTSFLTDVVKNEVGRPRPDLLDRCKPKDGTTEHALSSIDVCTQTNQHVLQEGWRSFPSGHSSFSFSGLGYLALFIAGQLHVFRPRTDLARVLVSLVPLIAALLIAISRLEDYRHDVYDVTVGSLLGMTVAHFTYRRYYPSLKSSLCDTPYPSPGEELHHGFSKLRDEEEGLEGGQRSYESVPLRDRR